MSKRIPEVKAWDDGTAVLEKNCVPIWHLGCAAINALDAENKRLQVGWDCAELAVFLKDGLKKQAEAVLALSREQTDYANDAMMAMCKRAEKAEEELAFVRARHCEDCAIFRHCSNEVLTSSGEAVTIDYCNLWIARV